MTELAFCRAHDRAPIRVTGRDARQFLHAQTTQRLDDLAPNETRTAAWLTPKGRVRAVFDVVPDGEDFWLVTEAGNADWLAAELGRYVLRADVRLEAGGERAVYSIVGGSREWLETRGLGLDRHGVAGGNGGIWFRVAPARVDIVARPADIEPSLAGLGEATADAAALAAIAVGRPRVPAALRDRYVAQMLNLDRLGAISFTKGCYPGQEIVARAQNLGEVKRRLARFRTGAGARPETGGVLIDAASQPAGEIDRVAAAGAGYELLAVTRIDTADQRLTLETDARELEPLPLGPDD
jgi:tRNA-modifying protein YgfZ